MLGQSLGNYTIERELGRGGMGAVYTAVHGLLGRRAAVKVLLPELSKNQDIVQRFFNEARAATAINHPSIVEIYDFGWAPDGSAYIVMELMDGESLSARVRRQGRLSVANAVTIARQIANALAAAHKAGIVHRDLKPDNIFLVPDIEVAGGERVKLLDFGIAKLAAEGAVSRTTTGAIMGTPLYMSPEQCEGARQVDHRTDLYALGCILFEMITGRVPFVHDGVGGLIGMHLYVEPPALRSLAPEAPTEVEAIVARLLAKKPDERFQTADELAAALARAGAVSLSPAPIGLAHTMPAPPPVSGLDTTLSSAASARISAARTGSSGGGSRRGVIAAIAGVVVVGAIVTVAIIASGGKTTSTTTPSVTIDATAVVDVPVDAGVVDATEAVSSSQAAVARLRDFLERHRWADAHHELDTIYDTTTDGHPDRAEADDLIAFARPHILEEVTHEIEALSKKGECKDAKQKAADTAEMWGDDMKPLVKLAAKCKAATPTPKPPEPKPPEPKPPEPKPPEPEPDPGRLGKDAIVRVMSRARPRVQSCGVQHRLLGTVVARIVIEPDGSVSSATIARGGDGGGDGDSCITQVLAQLRFPSSAAQTTINFPFVVRPAADAPTY